MSTAHADILDQHESLRGPFTAATLLHAGVIGGLVVYTWISGQRDAFGDPNAGGAAVGIEAVKAIPLPHSGPPNPVAHDSPSEISQQPVKQERLKREPPPPKDAIALKSRAVKEKRAPVVSQPQPRRFKSFEEIDPSRIVAQQPQAVSNPLFSEIAGAGRIGAGMNTTLGNRFGEYSQRIQQLVAQKWHPTEVDARVRSAPQVVVTFDLMRDGSISKPRIVDSSGISSLDISAQRAILEASPFPPMPAAFEGKSTTVTFTFELKR